MESTKSELNRHKMRGKLPCSSSQSSKFIEKEGLSGFNLSFSNVPSSLCDFIPKDQDSLSHEIDFDIAKNLRKLDKKDPLTKQKSLNDLINMFDQKDASCVISTLKFWPKLYNRLSLDEDKKVRELTQQLMGRYSSICGKELSTYVKQLLPTWIISQSDLHLAAANIAKQTFISTFPDRIKQEKAYLLCWRSIYEIISLSLFKTPLDIKEDNVSYTTKEEAYIQDIVINIRTIITLSPYLKNNDDAVKDLATLLKSKNFWSHFKLNVSLIQSIYIQLGIELLDNLPELVINTPTISSSICESLRMINNYHPHLISRIWSSIVKCCEILNNQVWKIVSFKTNFLPKLVKLFESGADGNISQIYTCMLPLFTHLPIELECNESVTIYEQIIQAMLKTCECPRIINNELEANCTVRMIFECSVYVMIIAGKKGNDKLVKIIFDDLLELAEKYFTDIRFKKSTKAIAEFTNCVIRSLVNKDTIAMTAFTDVILQWIDKHHTSALFCENLTAFFLELDKYSSDQLKLFTTSLLEQTEIGLRVKIIDGHQQCLIPYFYVCFSINECNLWCNDDSAISVLEQCPYLMREYSTSVTDIISRGLTKVLCNSLTCDVSKFNQFLSFLSADQISVFFTRFYTSFMCHITNANLKSVLSDLSLSNWKQAIKLSIDLILMEKHDTPTLPYLTMINLCRQIDVHEQHMAVLIKCIDDSIAAIMTRSMSTDTVGYLISLMQSCISDLIDHSSDLAIIPGSFIKNLFNLILCSSTENCHGDMSLIVTYLQHCQLDTCLELSKHLINECLLTKLCTEVEFLSSIVKLIVDNSTEDTRNHLINHIESILMQDLLSIETALSTQLNYSSIMVYSKHDLIVHAIQEIIVLNPLVSSDSDCTLRTAINCACILVNSMLTRLFSSCHNSNQLLNQCEEIHKIVHSLDLTCFLDHLLASASTRITNLPIFDQCPTLVICALQQMIPTNYSQWSDKVRDAMDLAINTWTESELTNQHLMLIIRVLLPCGIKARYLVQEVILATIMSYLSEDASPTIANINRSLAVMASLSSVDSSYFTNCYPILMSVKSKFDVYLDQLNPADINQPFSDQGFCLTSLLQFILVGVESCSLNQNQWEFIFCLIDTLIRSEPFSNCGNYRSNSIVGDYDHLLNAYWLLKVVSTTTVSLASVNIDPVIDEWENFFSEPIFTAILDQFTLVSGDHTIGRLVYSDLFSFYIEALTDVISLCPINILLSYNFAGQINISDPVDLPKDFLIVFNVMLESMSSYSLSVQLAAYNCLQNLTEKLSELLLEQVNAAEKNESMELFYINFPYKLLQYMAIDNFDQLNIDKLENQIILVRCFLSWNIVLQLFSTAQPKLRAEISTFLSQNDRLFDKFLNFCFAFMPKNPIVSKKHLSFIEANNSCNLISEEPYIFSQCIEKRSKFIIYHLSAYIFRRSMQILPNLCRGWWKSLDTNSQQIVDSYVRQFLTRELFKIEFQQLKEIVGKQFDEKIEIKTIPMIGEVTVKYNVSCDQSLEQLIKLPSNYPIGNINAEYKKELTVKIPHWKHWIGQMTMTLENQNGSIFDGIKLWKRNLDNYFNGIEDCMICYSIIHPSKYTLPSMPCYQCKKKFHKECMFKWFHSSTNPTCPNCRNVFYDGSQKSYK